MLTKEQCKDLEGSRIGDFIIEELINYTSGQAVIYKARSTGLRRELALKIFGLASTADGRSINAGKREIEASILDHTSVIKYYPAGEAEILFMGKDQRIVYIPMDYSPLGSCDSSPFKQDGYLSEEDYESVISLLDGLDAIHRSKAQIIHEDIKPANILKFEVEENGKKRINLKITDFGISKMNLAFGVGLENLSGATLPYMSPEQLDHKHSQKGDIYSMGATLFYMITGEEPIRVAVPTNKMGMLHIEMQNAHKTLPRPNPRDYAKGCHPRLALLIMRMMSVLPENRPDLGECKDEMRKIVETDRENKFKNNRLSSDLENALQPHKLPIYYTADFSGVFKPEVHTRCNTTFFVFQIEMEHAVHIQYRGLIEKITSYFSDSFSLYETWGQKDVIILLWSNNERVKEFVEDFKKAFYGSVLDAFSASKIHHFPADEFKSLIDPHLVYALAIQENKKLADLTEDIKKEYTYRHFPPEVPEDSVRAFTFIETVKEKDRENFRQAIVGSAKEIMEQLVKKIDPRDKKRCFRKPRVIEFEEKQSKICMIDFVVKNYRYLVDVPTEIIEAFGANTVKTTTFLETRRVVLQSDKILFLSEPNPSEK